jgi:hypothetical protein
MHENAGIVGARGKYETESRFPSRVGGKQLRKHRKEDFRALSISVGHFSISDSEIQNGYWEIVDNVTKEWDESCDFGAQE